MAILEGLLGEAGLSWVSQGECELRGRVLRAVVPAKTGGAQWALGCRDVGVRVLY